MEKTLPKNLSLFRFAEDLKHQQPVAANMVEKVCWTHL
jgi:hypothetical protein